MTIRTGLIRITEEEGKLFTIWVGQPEWEPGDSPFYYTLTFAAAAVAFMHYPWVTLYPDVRAAPPDVPWVDQKQPPYSVDGYYSMGGSISTFDRYSAEALTFLRAELYLPNRYATPAFDFSFVDLNGVEHILAEGVTEYTWTPTPTEESVWPILAAVGIGTLFLGCILVALRKR